MYDNGDWGLGIGDVLQKFSIFTKFIHSPKSIYDIFGFSLFFCSLNGDI